MALFPLLDGSKGGSDLFTPELLWGFGLLWKAPLLFVVLGCAALGYSRLSHQPCVACVVGAGRVRRL